MLSPEMYYETHLKGKNAEEIMRQIRGLKAEIGHLKKVLEEPEGYPEEPDRMPGADVRLTRTREYLERAKQVLAEAGGKYIPSKREIAGERLEAELDRLSRFCFRIGGFCGGCRTYIVTLKEDGGIGYYVENMWIPAPSNLETSEPWFSKEEFQGMLAELHLGEWRKNYVDQYICDGTQWELTLIFSDEHEVCYGGSNRYPWCFDILKGFFGETDD